MTARPTDEGTTQRAGGWVEGIGWVARAGTLRPGDEDVAAWPVYPGVIGTEHDALTIVTRWADGTVPAPPAASRTPEPGDDGLREAVEAIAHYCHAAAGSERAPADAVYDEIGHKLYAALAARSTPPTEQADGLEQVGWLGATWEDATWHDLDADLTLVDGEAVVVERNDGQYVYEPGGWSIRHEDGADDLIAPIPLYAKAADLAAYTAPADHPDGEA